MPKGFKKVPGYQNRYQINRHGEIVCKNVDGWRVVSQSDHNGYKMVSLYDKETKTTKKWLVHRLVAFVYLYDQDDQVSFTDYEVHHIDSDKSNVNPSNLLLVSHEDHLLEHQIMREFMKYVVTTKKFKNYRKIRLANLRE